MFDAVVVGGDREAGCHKHHSADVTSVHILSRPSSASAFVYPSGRQPRNWFNLSGMRCSLSILSFLYQLLPQPTVTVLYRSPHGQPRLVSITTRSEPPQWMTGLWGGLPKDLEHNVRF